MKALARKNMNLTFEGVDEDCDAGASNKNDKLHDFQSTTGLYYFSHNSSKIIRVDGILITLNVFLTTNMFEILMCSKNVDLDIFEITHCHILQLGLLLCLAPKD